MRQNALPHAGIYGNSERLRIEVCKALDSAKHAASVSGDGKAADAAKLVAFLTAALAVATPLVRS